VLRSVSAEPPIAGDPVAATPRARRPLAAMLVSTRRFGMLASFEK
jgi:hypothetical protein